jgi:hypothetical protein
MKFVISILVLAMGIYFLTKNSSHLKDDLEGADSSSEQSINLAKTPAKPIAAKSMEAKPSATTTNLRNTASVPKDMSALSLERQMLKDLLLTSHQANAKPELRDKARELRDRLKSMPNSEAALWEHYQSLLDAKASPYERVEVLDLLLTNQQNQKLADVALAEALQAQIPETIRIENAKNEKELNIASTTTPEMIPPIVAFDIYLKSCGAYPNCQQGALAMIGSNPNANLRSNLISGLVSRFPDQRDQIRSDLVKFGLTK